MWRQRGGLQVGEGSLDRLVPHAVDRGAERPLRAHQHGARNQQLGGVDVDRRLRRTERCGCPAPHNGVVDRRRSRSPRSAGRGRSRRREALRPGARAARAVRRSPSPAVDPRARRRRARSVTISASPSVLSAAVTTRGVATPACAAIRVANASCSTCSSRPTGALRGGSRNASERYRRVHRWVSCASRPSTRTFSGSPDSDEPTYSVEPIRCCAAIRSSRTPTPSSTSARRTASAVGTPSEEPNATRTRMPAVRPSAMLPRALDGSAAPMTTAPSAASADRQATSFRAGTTSSGPATVNTATTTATLSSGNPQLENTPVSTATQSESTSAAENGAEDADDQHDCDKVTGERPSPVPHDVDDDQRSRDQRRGEDDSPERRRPVQELAQRHRRAGVRLGCRGRHQCDQSGRDREGREKDHVDGATVSAGRVCVDQQRKARGLTRRWHSLSRHAHPSASRRWRRLM